MITYIGNTYVFLLIPRAAMASANPVEISSQKRVKKMAKDDPLKLLAAFFKGLFNKFDEENS